MNSPGRAGPNADLPREDLRVQAPAGTGWSTNRVALLQFQPTRYGRLQMVKGQWCAAGQPASIPALARSVPDTAWHLRT